MRVSIIQQISQISQMKVKLKSVLKSSICRYKWMEDSQLIYQAGNNLCIGQISKPASQFINLNIYNSHLYDFALAPTRNYVFTIEKNQLTKGIELSAYPISVNTDRKVFALSDHPNFMPLESISTIELLPDEFDFQHIFVITKNINSDVCISLVDFSKNKMVAHGFLGSFESSRICSLDNFEISISGKSFLRRLHAQDGVWVIEERLPKKLNNIDINHHEWLPGNRIITTSSNTAYLIQDGQVVQTIPVCDGQETITHLRKIGKAFFIITNELKLQLYVEENEVGTYSLVETLTLPFKKIQQNPNIPLGQPQDQITQIQISKNEEDVLIVTNQGKLYHSKIEDFSSLNIENYFSFQLKPDASYSKEEEGAICTSSGQSYCLLSNQKKIELWDLDKVSPLTTMLFSTIQDKRVVWCSALNPDGHSFCLGFHDKIKFYRILINSFRQFAEYSVRKSKILQYSHGGQFLASVSGKGASTILSIFNTLSMRQVHVFKLGYKVSQIIWNQFDDQIYISASEASSITIFRVSTKSKIDSFCVDQRVSSMRYDYLSKKLLVSAGQKVYRIDKDQEMTVINPSIDNFHYIFPIEGIYLAADTKGTLYCSNTIDFGKKHQIPIFLNKPFKMEYHKGTLIAYTSPSNSFVLDVEVAESQKKPERKEDIVLVSREEINKFFQKVITLEKQFDRTQDVTSLKLEDERKNYDQSLEQNSKKFQNQMQFLQKRFNELQTEKSYQEKDNAKVFQNLQSGQIRSVNDLEKVYDLKIRMQKEKYLGLEQDLLEQKMKYENLIKDLEKKYHSDIEKVRKQYSVKMEQEVKMIQNQKNRSLEYKRKMETKIIDLEEESELTLLELQLSKDNRIKNLIQKQIKLERDHDSTMIELHNTRDDLEAWKTKYEASNERVKENEKIIKENMNRVCILQSDIEKKNQIIDDKNIVIDQQTHQIEALEKAKYVLNFRTTQIRKGLEPKDALIDKLKSEFFKLEEEYKKQAHKNFQISQKLEKIQKLSITMKKENTELKNSYKLKDRLHEELCYQLFVLVNNEDPKQWNAGLVKLYQTYAQEEKQKSKTTKKNDNTSEEINRHLIHVEQSLHQVATGNEKMLKGKQKQIVRKMKENAELIHDYNLKKKELNEREGEISQMRTQIAKLKRELHESSQGHRSTRVNTANTGATRRVMSRDANNIGGQTADWIDLSIKRQSEYMLPDKKNRTRVYSAHRTMVWREDGKKDKSRISDFAKELQSCKNTIKRQDRMIEELNQRLLGLPEDMLN